MAAKDSEEAAKPVVVSEPVTTIAAADSVEDDEVVAEEPVTVSKPETTVATKDSEETAKPVVVSEPVTVSKPATTIAAADSVEDDEVAAEEPVTVSKPETTVATKDSDEAAKPVVVSEPVTTIAAADSVEAARVKAEQDKATKDAEAARVKAEQAKAKAAQDAEAAASYQAIKLSISNFEAQSTEASKAAIDDALAQHLNKSGKNAQELWDAEVVQTVAADKRDGLQEVFKKHGFAAVNKPDEQKPAPQPNIGADDPKDKPKVNGEQTLLSRLMTKEGAFATLAAVMATYVAVKYGYPWVQAKRKGAAPAAPVK